MTIIDFKGALTLKSKHELVEILGNVADSLDINGKDYVDQFEKYLRKVIGYPKYSSGKDLNK